MAPNGIDPNRLDVTERVVPKKFVAVMSEPAHFDSSASESFACSGLRSKNERSLSFTTNWRRAERISLSVMEEGVVSPEVQIESEI